MTLAEALRETGRRLDPIAGSGRLDALLILEQITGLTRERFIIDDRRVLTGAECDALAGAVAQRLTGMPVAYITKTAGFYGRTFAVDQRVLVPRPETEHLIEVAIGDLRARGKRESRVADIGTGSGAIAITLAAEVSGAWAFGTDVSRDAIAVARGTAAANKVFQECTFLHGDLAQPLARFAPFDCIVANLPYVPTSEIAPAPDPVSFEPRLALDGGADGLDLYRRLLPQLAPLLAPRALVVLEAAPPTIAALTALVQAAFPREAAEIGTDYAGLERFVAFRPE
jgi:release factor glutamine methyltransferase